MLLVLVLGGGLLGVALGAVARASYGPQSWPDSRKFGLLIAVLPTAGLVGLLLPLAHYGIRLPVCVYLVSLLTGYTVVAMLEAGPALANHRLSKRRTLGHRIRYLSALTAACQALK